jgi:DNA-binding transcriptional LysR family regulator
MQSGSMARAASHLGISQPAVSDSIADLESALGVRLLDRGRRGVEPTVYGKTLVKFGKAAFDELRQGIKQIEFLSDPMAGEVRISCPESISSGVLVPIIERLVGRYPRVRSFVSVEQQLVTPTRHFPQLENREVDLVIARLLMPGARNSAAHPLKTEVLFYDRIRLATGKHTPLAHRRSIELADLASERWIMPPADSAAATALTKAFRAYGLEPPNIKMTTYSVHLRNSFANRGYIVALPASVLRFNSNDLQELPVDLPMPPWPVALLTLKDRTLNPVADRFIECAREVSKSIGEAPPAPKLRVRRHRAASQRS